MVRAVATLISIFSYVAATTAFAAGPYGSIHLGNWKGGAYTNNTTGSFDHCAAEIKFANGLNMAIGKNTSNIWSLGFQSETFGLTVGETYPIDVTFDGQAQYHLFGKAALTTTLGAAIPNDNVLNHFRTSRLMVVVMQGATYQFILISMKQLLPMIENCVTKTVSAGINISADFSIPPPSAPAAKPAVQSNPPASSAPVSSPKPSRIVETTGTGFVVSTNGHVVTNNHVIKGCVGDIHGNLTGDADMTLRIVSTDEGNDLALLQAPREFKEVATIRGTAIHPGDTVIAIGYPFHGLLSSEFTVTTGIVSSLSGIFNNTRYLQISAAVQPGNSGGPLFDTSGNVVGVVSAKLDALKMVKATGTMPENINFAIKQGALRDFLDNSVVSYRVSEPTGDLKTAEIVQNARSYTLLISCSGNAND